MPRRSTMSRQKAGRLGAEARWGKSRKSQNGQSSGHNSGKLSRQEAARRGGRALVKEYGPHYFEELGRRGGEAVYATYGPEFYEEIGRRGGRAVASKYGTTYYRNIGRRGGEALYEEYGPEYFEELGHSGGKAVYEEYGPAYYRDINRRRGLARWEKEDEGNYRTQNQGKRMTREEAGRKGAEARWGQRYENEDESYAYSTRGSERKYHEADRYGDEGTSARHRRDFYQEIGRKGNKSRR